MSGPVAATWHVLTPEYPPDDGGVADYVHVLAPALAASAGAVHVWCPGPTDASATDAGDVIVHRRREPFTGHGLEALHLALDACAGPRVLLVEYVPHGFGRKGMNVPLARWLLARRRRGDDVRVMFHEVAHPWVGWPLHHNLIAAVQRTMAERVVRAAHRIYVSIPGWVPLLERLGAAPGSLTWAPIPATVPDAASASAVDAVRRGVTAGASPVRVVGHFGTYGESITSLLEPVLSALLARRPDVRVMLLGGGGDRWREEFVTRHPAHAARVFASGRLPASDVAVHLRACDLVVQPYPDGVSSRRSSVMAAVANGVPVITTSGHLTEPALWTDVVAAAPVGRSAELAVLTSALLDDDARREALGRAGRRAYAAHFALPHTLVALGVSPLAPAFPASRSPASDDGPVRRSIVPLRLAVVRDFRAEGWPSMDLCADELLSASATVGDAVCVSDVAPDFHRMLTRVPFFGRTRTGRNADRARNRYTLLPRHLRPLVGRFDAFHVVDHSYAHVLDVLPAARTGVFCHDLDAFTCLLEPARDLRPRWFRALMRRVLDGLGQAGRVFHATEAVGRALRERGLVDPARLVHAPLGVAGEFTAVAATPPPPLPSLVRLDGAPYLLHVGGVMARKRIDVLIDAFAAARETHRDLRLVKVGDPFTREQETRLSVRGLQPAVVHAGRLSRPALAEAYRRAAVVVVPSEAEGFGLPVIEALACGTSVVASDLPALRESGGATTRYCPVGDVAAFAAAIAAALGESDADPVVASRVAWASRFTWAAHARTILAAYRELVRG